MPRCPDRACWRSYPTPSTPDRAQAPDVEARARRGPRRAARRRRRRPVLARFDSLLRGRTTPRRRSSGFARRPHRITRPPNSRWASCTTSASASPRTMWTRSPGTGRLPSMAAPPPSAPWATSIVRDARRAPTPRKPRAGISAPPTATTSARNTSSATMYFTGTGVTRDYVGRVRLVFAGRRPGAARGQPKRTARAAQHCRRADDAGEVAEAARRVAAWKPPRRGK